MSEKKYVGLTSLQTFLDKLKYIFSDISHKHSISDIDDYKVDDCLSSVSASPVQNKVLDAKFEEIAGSMKTLGFAINDKSDSDHMHDLRYYTQEQIDRMLSEKVSVQIITLEDND